MKNQEIIKIKLEGLSDEEMDEKIDNLLKEIRSQFKKNKNLFLIYGSSPLISPPQMSLFCSDLRDEEIIACANICANLLGDLFTDIIMGNVEND